MDSHIIIYFFLSVLIVVALLLIYKELQITTFDPSFSQVIGIPIRMIEAIFLGLVALVVAIGINSVGIVLMSGMLIMPAIAARQFTDRLHILFLLSASFGAASTILGNFVSLVGAEHYFGMQTNLPTGPMILLIGAFFCFFSLLFAPKKGMVFMLLRSWHFRYQCLLEHLLKSLWKESGEMDFKSLQASCQLASIQLSFLLWRLRRQGWAISGTKWKLTTDGMKRAAKLVRLHRLWEVYLTQYLDVTAARVHRSADQIEHILTGELEEHLETLLDDPISDPHAKPIPMREVTF